MDAEASISSFLFIIINLTHIDFEGCQTQTIKIKMIIDYFKQK